MIKYIFFNSYKNLPNQGEVLSFVYNKSFRNDEFAGSYFNYKDEENPISMILNWPKWVENKKLPEYTKGAYINIIFPPLSRRDINFSKNALKKAEDMNYKYCATIFIGNAKHQILRKVALIDLKVFIEQFTFL